MAITIITHRKGKYSDFDPARLLPAEIGVVQNGDPESSDGTGIYIAVNSNEVKRIATHDELQGYDNEAREYAQAAAIANNSAAENARLAQTTYAKIQTSEQNAVKAANDAANTLASVESAVTTAKEKAIADFNTAANEKQADVIKKIDAEYESDKTEFNKTYESALDTINKKAEQVAQIASNADTVAAQATQIANEALNESAEIGSKLSNVDQKLNKLQFDIDSAVYDGYVDVSGYLVLTDIDGNMINRLGPFAGDGSGGGGGSQVDAEFEASNTTGWISATISNGDSCPVKITWSSVENNMSTGPGKLSITVNGITKATLQVQQGEVTTDIAPYLNSGNNSVKLRISDVYDQLKTFSINVQVVSLVLTSTFDTSSPFTGTISFPYTPIGDVSKTIYFILDGNTVGTQTTSVSGKQLTYSIPAQKHGAHTFSCYFESEINGQLVRSNELYYELICIEPLNDTVIITSPFNLKEVKQYANVPISFTVYDPINPTAEVTLYVNDVQVSKQTVDRSEQSYTLKPTEVGALKFDIKSGSTTKSLVMNVIETEIDVEPVTENLVLYLSSTGRSNNEENPDVWTYNDITTTFTGNNHVTDGWIADEDGNVARRFSGDARGVINFKLFERDFRTTGKTISIEFATRNVLNYDAEVISCMSGDRGLSITAQMATLSSEQSLISTQYKEDEHIRLDWVIEKRNENRVGLIYINGIICGAIQYPEDDDFSQAVPVNISLGSNDCVLDLYTIRVYDNNLNRTQVLDNWISDTPDGSDMLERYTRNNIYDAYGNIVISQLPSDLPYLVIECEELPQYKGDKKTCSGYYIDPVHPSKSFTFTNAQLDVQGTSSQYYPRKNYKAKYRNGFVTSSGTNSTYAINNDAVPTNTFTYKKDFASSEGANNVELARLYNDVCPYKTPGQTENPKIRQGIDGFPIVIFWHNTLTDNTSFIGKYNFNNDKGTPEVFGFKSDDESWEIKNNTSNRVIWKDNNYSGTAWLNDFEARYPDLEPAYTDPTQLQEFATWAKSTDTTTATGNKLASPVTYTVTTAEVIQHVDPDTGAITYEEVEVTKDVTFTNDTAEYRLAKFKDEAKNYMEMQSALFYYLFTELFLMVDSRAKNAFPSFMGSEVN